MRLVGMLDSPYVRRTAISLRLMGFEFELSQISVFRAIDEFKAINPVIKVPTLVTDDGIVLMDSSLILDYLERLAGASRSLMPPGGPELVEAFRVLGLALAAYEKTVQIVYERGLRPPEKQHQPWLDRVQGQLLAAYGELENAMPARAAWFGGDKLSQPDITVAVGWHFTQHAVPEIVKSQAFPRLSEFSARAEVLPAFAEMAY